MSNLRATQRAKELGELGGELLSYLKKEDFSIATRPVEEQFYAVALADKKGERIRAAATSLLCCDYATQVVLTKHELLRLALAPKKHVEVRRSNHKGRFFDPDKQKVILPLKAHPGARNKVNVYFSELLNELQTKEIKEFVFVMEQQWMFASLYDDQASALLLYAQALRPELGDRDAWAIAVACVHDTLYAKSLSTIIKSLGINGTSYGSKLCEANTLVGRGVAPLDVESELLYRLDRERVKESVVNFDEDKLRIAVRKIIQTEILQKPTFPEVGEHWSKRWAWCVNGAHSGALSRFKPKYSTAYRRRMHRRVFAENLEHEPVTDWDGSCLFTISEKLEHGKTRAIFGGDSVTYFAFDHLLSHVEKKWRGYRVVLDPGRGGASGMAGRVEKLRGAWHVMLDYDDFNSQHSLSSQKLVIEETVRATGYDYVKGRKLVESFDNQFVVVDGQLRRLEGTLMSGHRATTFINSVLNLAYIMCAEPAVWDMQSIHVGDDIYVSAPSAVSAAKLLRAVQDSGVRMNPLKQSIGTHTAEFLRHASGPKASYGYVARSISSVVSGNWVSENKLDPRQFVSSVIQSAWTLRNRSQTNVSSLLARSVNRVTGMKLNWARKLMLGELSLDNSPVLAEFPSVPQVEMRMEALDRRVDLASVAKEEGKFFATKDYLAHHVTPVEVIAVREAGVDVSRIMAESSYKKTLIDTSDQTAPTCSFTDKGRALRPCTAQNLEELREERPDKGVLDGLPIISLIRDRLSIPLVAKLLNAMGVNAGVGKEVMRTAFSDYSARGRRWAHGYIPFSDLTALEQVEDLAVYPTRNRFF